MHTKCAGRPRHDVALPGYRGDFARRLRALRERAGRSVAQAAERAELAPATWLDYESGRRLPRLDWLPAIARAVGVSARELLPE